MPFYDFEAEDGEKITELLSIRDDTRIIYRDGKEYRRLSAYRTTHRYALWHERPDQEENRRAAEESLHKPNPNMPGGVSMMEGIKKGYCEPPPGSKVF